MVCAEGETGMGALEGWDEALLGTVQQWSPAAAGRIL